MDESFERKIKHLSHQHANRRKEKRGKKTSFRKVGGGGT